MRIAYISNSIIPSKTANSIHVMKMCQSFAKNGHDVSLIAPDTSSADAQIKDVFEYYDVDRLFEVIKLPWLEVTGRAYLYGMQIARHIKKVKPDVIYGRYLHGCYMSSLINKNIPIYFESHAPYHKKIEVLMLKRLLKARSLKKLIVISQSLKDYYIDQYTVPPELIQVAHDGADAIDSSRSAAKPTLMGRHEAMRVGYIGHLYPGRGISIVKELAERCSWAEFHLVGGTEKDIEYWEKECMHVLNIHFYGYMPYAEATRYRQSFDVLLAPYEKKVAVHGGKGDTSKWMSPLKIFEYMATGKPILCSDLPVLKEVFTHGESAILCNPDDVNEWTAALNSLRDSEPLRTSLGINAQSKFLSQYTWLARAKQVLQ